MMARSTLRYKDNLEQPKLKQKPKLDEEDMLTYHRIVHKVIQACADNAGIPLALDQATISATNDYGHKKHADNLVFGVW